MDWDKLRVFHAVAVAGGFTHAEEILHISHSSISRHVNQLERDLKATLFHRHPRGIHLTGAGEMLFEAVKDIYSKLDHTQNRIIDSSNMPRGPLRIALAYGFGGVWITQQIKGFCEAYPEMEIHLLYQEKMADLSMGEADIGIRTVKADHGDLIYTPFMNFRYGFYAAKEYLDKKGTPKKIEDFVHHDMLALDLTSELPVRYFNWYLKYKDMNINPILYVNSAYAMYLAIQNGMGIGVISGLMSYNEKNVKEVKIESESHFDLQSYFAYPVELRKTERVRVFIEYMTQKARLDGWMS